MITRVPVTTPWTLRTEAVKVADLMLRAVDQIDGGDLNAAGDALADGGEALSILLARFGVFRHGHK